MHLHFESCWMSLAVLHSGCLGIMRQTDCPNTSRMAAVWDSNSYKHTNFLIKNVSDFFYTFNVECHRKTKDTFHVSGVAFLFTVLEQVFNRPMKV